MTLLVSFRTAKNTGLRQFTHKNYKIGIIDTCATCNTDTVRYQTSLYDNRSTNMIRGDRVSENLHTTGLFVCMSYCRYKGIYGSNELSVR